MSSPAWQRDGDDLLVELYVQPRASRDAWAGLHGNALKLRITAPPVDGKANAQLVRFLASEFGVARSNITLVRGERGRRKRFRITGAKKIPAALELD